MFMMPTIINKLKQKHILFLILPLGLLIFMVVVLIMISTGQETQMHPSNKKPTATPIPITIQSNPLISSVMPKEKEINVSILTPIRIVFTKPLSESEKNSFILSFNPNILGKQSWSNNNQTLTYTPTAPLLNAQNYSVSLTQQEKVYGWVFKTVSIENMSEEDQVKEQERSDANFRQWEQTVQQNYPWLDSLPLHTDSYFFYFDIDTKMFIGKLYPKESDSTAEDDQVTAMKEEIMKELIRLGVPTTQYPITWKVLPE